MEPSVLTALLDGGTASIVIILILTGWLVPGWVHKKSEEEARLLREALQLERQRNGEMASTTGVTNQLIGALVELAGERDPQGRLSRRSASGKGDAPGTDLTWKDLT